MIDPISPRTSPTPLILLEDDVGVRRSLQLLLQGQGFTVHSFSAAASALADPESIKATHAVVDYALPDSDGVTFVRQLRERGWTGEAILITAYSSARVAEGAHQAGISAIIAKPFRDTELLDALAARV